MSVLGSGKFSVAQILDGCKFVRYHYDASQSDASRNGLKDLLFCWNGRKKISIINVSQEKEVDCIKLSSFYWPDFSDPTKRVDEIIDAYIHEKPELTREAK